MAVDYIANACEIFESFGVNVQEIFELAGVEYATLSKAGYRYPIHELNRLYCAASRKLNQPLLSLHVGARVRLRSFPVIGYAAMCSQTLGQAIGQLQRFEPLVWDFGSTVLKLDASFEEGARLEWQSSSEGIPSFLVEIAIAGWLAFGKEVLNSDLRLIHGVYFQHQPLADIVKYEALLGVRVYFNANFNGVEFAHEALSSALTDADPSMRQLVESVGERQLQHYSLEVNIVNSVSQRILSEILDDFSEPSLDSVAESLDLSSKQLARRLSEQGQSFTRLLDAVRKELVREWLAVSELSLAEVAFALGFSEQSAFTRAFKRWYHVTPAEYRRTLNA